MARRAVSRMREPRLRGRTSYAAARRAELAAALRESGATPELAELGAADQQASLALKPLIGQLAGLLREHGARAVITQPTRAAIPITTRRR